MADYGYGDAVPDSAAKYGYEPATPNGQEDNPYGYGDGAPNSAAASKYGYGDATPDTDKYGYGDAAPDSDPYGYGDSAPDTDKYGYGDAAHDNQSSGYEDTYQTGYNDEDEGNVHSSAGGAMQPDSSSRRGRRTPGRSHSDDHLSVNSNSHHSVATAESYGDYGYGSSEELDSGGGDNVHELPRRQRYRRRGSVTKYSLEAQDTVQKEFDANAQAIHHYREGGEHLEYPPPTDSMGDLNISADDHDSDEDPSSSSPSSRKDKKKGRKNRFRRFTMGY